jgi:hypothetical protein
MQGDEKVDLSYSALWRSIIRPPRDDYSEDQMGEAVFTYRGKTYLRKDYNLIDKQGFLIKCSFIEPDEESRVS